MLIALKPLGKWILSQQDKPWQQHLFELEALAEHLGLGHDVSSGTS